jgi:hypothetical protein
VLVLKWGLELMCLVLNWGAEGGLVQELGLELASVLQRGLELLLVV